MSIIYISSLLGFLMVAFLSFFPTKKALIKKYGNLNQKNLICKNIFARRISMTSLACVFIVIPVAMGFVMPIFKERLAREAVISLFILMVSCGITLYGIFWRIVGVTEEELKHREGKIRK